MEMDEPEAAGGEQGGGTGGAVHGWKSGCLVGASESASQSSAICCRALRATAPVVPTCGRRRRCALE
jgi:hypothetical protein